MHLPHLHTTCQIADHGRVDAYFPARWPHLIPTATRLTIDSATI